MQSDTEEPMQNNFYQVIVVGAGIHGSAAAYKITNKLGQSNPGSRILLLEQFDLLHNKGSSHGHSRICRYSDRDPVYARMGFESIKQWKQIEKKANCRVYYQTGGLDLGDENHEGLHDIVKAAQEVGFEYEILNADAIRKRFPAFSNIPDNYKGIYQANAGILNAADAVVMFHQLCQREKDATCDIHSNEKVITITESADSHLITVTTDKDTYTCKKIILACGSWIADLVKRNFNIDLDLDVRRMSYCLWKVSEKWEKEFAKLPIFIQWGPDPYATKTHKSKKLDWGFYGFPGSFEKDGYVKIALHKPFPEERFCDPEKRAKDINSNSETPVPREKVELIRSFIDHLFATGSFEHESYEDMYKKGNIVTCLYTRQPSDDYIADKLPGHDNIIIASPCSGHGFKNAPIVADFLVELVLEDNSACDKYLGIFDRSKFSLKPIIRQQSTDMK